MPDQDPTKTVNPDPAKERDHGSPRAIDPARESAGLEGGTTPDKPRDRRVEGIDPARESAGLDDEGSGSKP